MGQFIFFMVTIVLFIGGVYIAANEFDKEAAKFETVCQSGHILVTINRTPYCLIGHKPIIQKKAD